VAEYVDESFFKINKYNPVSTHFFPFCIFLPTRPRMITLVPHLPLLHDASPDIHPHENGLHIILREDEGDEEDSPFSSTVITLTPFNCTSTCPAKVSGSGEENQKPKPALSEEVNDSGERVEEGEFGGGDKGDMRMGEWRLLETFREENFRASSDILLFSFPSWNSSNSLSSFSVSFFILFPSFYFFFSPSPSSSDEIPFQSVVFVDRRGDK
jgi:hypothetical protein